LPPAPVRELDLSRDSGRNGFSSRPKKIKINGQMTVTRFDRPVPATEGIKYAGSKLKLLPFILELARRVRPRTVLDGFAGTTRVGQAFAQTGRRVVSSDVAVWSEIFGLCYLKNKKETRFFRELVEHLNELPPRDGWFTEHYGGAPGGKGSAAADGFKKPWQRHNTRRLDAIREEIGNLRLPATDEAVLLTSLILALDRVDNTLGHYAAYLNEWSPRSFHRLELKVPRLFASDAEHEVLRQDVFETIGRTAVDLAYFDPPYGSNNEKMPPSRVRYAAYYHLWTSIVLNDRPEVFGKARRRVDTSDKTARSVFEEFRRDEKGRFIATEAIAELIARTQARHIILSYGSGGRATAENLHEILGGAGRIVEFVEVDYRRNVMSAMRWTNDWIRESETTNREYLFLIEKG
jgi:adenine-specific DNA-methyltransferase